VGLLLLTHKLLSRGFEVQAFILDSYMTETRTSNTFILEVGSLGI
jgi:hypothetical protein